MLIVCALRAVVPDPIPAESVENDAFRTPDVLEPTSPQLAKDLNLPVGNLD